MKFHIKIGPSVFLVQSDNTPDDLYKTDGGFEDRDGMIYCQRHYFESWVVKCPDWENMMNMFSYKGDLIKRDMTIFTEDRSWFAHGCFVSEYVYATNCVHICIDWIV